MRKNSAHLARLLAATLVSVAAISAHADVAGQAQPVAAAQPATASAESDATIAENVKAALKNIAGAEAVSVSCKDGVVTLTGTVPAAAIEPALKATASVAGIKEVRNELKAG